MKNITILLVEDNPEDLFVLESLLRDINANLVKATTGRTALRSILLRDFSLVVMDIHLSDMSGIDVASLIRLRPRSATTPIIFTSAFSEEEFRMRYRLAPNNLAFISKPFDPEKLVAQVLFFIK